ncbi:PTS lactose transporter subunit IIB [Brachybacterium hainanense]|uniref:PTS lactose transporter subunit IIB n=1 Tax=Brachybacterium hainanense TaxID=1541174 RepID=A0ABV6RGD2_9MICO
MRTIAVITHVGSTTATMVGARIRDHFAERGRPVRIARYTVMDLLAADIRADVAVSTLELPTTLGMPVVSGMPLVLDTAPQRTLEEIEELLDRLDRADQTPPVPRPAKDPE